MFRVWRIEKQLGYKKETKICYADKKLRKVPQNLGPVLIRCSTFWTTYNIIHTFNIQVIFYRWDLNRSY